MAEKGHKVILNVYDLSPGLARPMSTTPSFGKAIEGIWHTGVEVYGNEYYIGRERGIQRAPAGSTSFGTPTRVVDLGVTHVLKDVFEMYLQEITPRYTAENYNLLAHNCNNFSNEVARFLVGAAIPDYILDSPGEVIYSQMRDKPPLGDARKVQVEISAEFAAIMASGTLRASEAAALATRRVMQRYGQQASSPMSQG